MNASNVDFIGGTSKVAIVASSSSTIDDCDHIQTGHQHSKMLEKYKFYKCNVVPDYNFFLN